MYIEEWLEEESTVHRVQHMLHSRGTKHVGRMSELQENLEGKKCVLI